MTGPEDTPPIYDWLVEHRRLVLASVLAVVGLVVLLLGWWGVSGTTVVADQLAYLAPWGTALTLSKVANVDPTPIWPGIVPVVTEETRDKKLLERCARRTLCR